MELIQRWLRAISADLLSIHKSKNWQDKVTDILFKLSIPLGLLVLLVSSFALYKIGNYVGIAIDAVFYLAFLVVYFLKTIPRPIKTFFMLTALFVVGFFSFLLVGPYSGGYLWLFTFSLVSTTLYAFRGALYSILINVVAFVFVWFFNTDPSTQWIFTQYGDLTSFVALFVNFVFLNIFTCLIIGAILLLLKDALAKSTSSTNELKVKHQNLELLNQSLENEIKEREHVNLKVVQSEARFKALFENAADAILLHSLDGTIYEMNNVAVERYGYSQDEIIGKNIDILLDEDIKKLLPERVEQLQKNERLRIESVHTAKDGTKIDVELNLKLIDFPEGELVLNIARNISLRKKAELEIQKLNNNLNQLVLERTAQYEDAMEELRNEILIRKKTETKLIKAQKELENLLNAEKELSALKTRFVSMVSHEYRTPLTVIMNSATLADIHYAKRNDTEFKKGLENINRSVRAMLHLMDDVLVFGSTELKDIDVRKENVDMQKFCQEVIYDIQLASGNQHFFDVRYDFDQPIFSTDGKLLGSILRNLVSNACKYTPPQKSVSLEAKSKSGILTIKVADQGIGIPPNDLPHLFEPFHRASNVGKIKGTGLGLALSKKFAVALKGDLTVESELNQGTTFYLVVKS